MKIIPTELEGTVIIEPDVHKDGRGFFLESYHAEKYRQGGIAAAFVQDNHSSSIRGTLRGLHGQREHPQGKLLRVIAGEIFDVAVDVRKGSPTFARWVSFNLSAENRRQIYVPPGFFHGFCVLSETAEVEYKCTDFYAPGDEIGVIWNDPQIGVDWPVKDPILSAKDAALPRLSEILEKLPE